ncbi:hypothetical protein LINPERHAP1_LOCUS10508 [Linum perenne]
MKSPQLYLYHLLYYYKRRRSKKEGATFLPSFTFDD